MSKVLIDLDTLEQALAYRRLANSVPLEDVVWLRNGLPAQVDERLIAEWQFIGLNNTDFAEEALLGTKKSSTIAILLARRG